MRHLISKTKPLKIPYSEFSQMYVAFSGFCTRCGAEHYDLQYANKTSLCKLCGTKNVKGIDVLFIEKMLDTSDWKLSDYFTPT